MVRNVIEKMFGNVDSIEVVNSSCGQIYRFKVRSRVFGGHSFHQLLLNMMVCVCVANAVSFVTRDSGHSPLIRNSDLYLLVVPAGVRATLVKIG